MKSILIIGLGRFGTHLCMNLSKLDNEIMIVDECEERLEDLLPYVTSAKIGDCTNIKVLESLGVSNFDLCIVCIGNNFQNSLEVTSLLKDLGAKHIVSKANPVSYTHLDVYKRQNRTCYTDQIVACCLTGF